MSENSTWSAEHWRSKGFEQPGFGGDSIAAAYGLMASSGASTRSCTDRRVGGETKRHKAVEKKFQLRRRNIGILSYTGLGFNVKFRANFREISLKISLPNSIILRNP